MNLIIDHQINIELCMNTICFVDKDALFINKIKINLR